ASAASAASALSAPKAPPADTLALNPYSRPDKPIHSGETPPGAQLLSSIRESPGGGRDLYASPDGAVYQRRDNGWYRRENTGRWSFYAPTQNMAERQSQAAARTQAGGGTVNRPGMTAAGAVVPARQLPNSGVEPRAQQVANLERQYY